MTMIRLTLGALALGAAIGLGACGASAKGPEAPAASLYDRLGGKDAITAVVKDFVEQRVAKDNRINAYFMNTDIPAFEALLADQICEATGGPCKYTGKDMKTSHVGMKIRDADFDALVEDLTASLDHFKVPAKEQRELLGALAPMRPDVVTAK